MVPLDGFVMEFVIEDYGDGLIVDGGKVEAVNGAVEGDVVVVG